MWGFGVLGKEIEVGGGRHVKCRPGPLLSYFYINRCRGLWSVYKDVIPNLGHTRPVTTEHVIPNSGVGCTLCKSTTGKEKRGDQN